LRVKQRSHKRPGGASAATGGVPEGAR
jgi:hypothetical protein